MKWWMCENCDSRPIEALNCAKKINDTWYIVCPQCGSKSEFDIEDYLLPKGTEVQFNDGSRGTIAGFTDTGAATAQDILYIIAPEGRQYRRDAFVVKDTWKKLRRVEGGIQRVCHHPQNEEWSNAPCYNCVDRGRCNAELFERLAAYEDTDMLPERIAEYKVFRDSLAGWGLSLDTAQRIIENAVRSGIEQGIAADNVEFAPVVYAKAKLEFNYAIDRRERVCTNCRKKTSVSRYCKHCGAKLFKEKEKNNNIMKTASI